MKTIPTSIWILSLVAATVLSAVCCKGDGPEEGGNATVTGVKISESAITIGPGATYTLAAVVQPKNAANKSVIWETDNSNILYINNGAVTGLKEGKAKVTVTTLDQFMTASCEVTVKANMESKDIKVFKPITIKVGETSDPIQYKVEPEGCNVGAFFSSNNTKIATVTPDGRVTGVSVGTASIMVRAGDNRMGYPYDGCDVNVVNELVFPTGVLFSNVPLDMQVGQVVDIMKTPQTGGLPCVVFSPTNANILDITVSSNDESSLSVTDNKFYYSVKALKRGTATLTVRTPKGASQSITINIFDKKP